MDVDNFEIFPKKEEFSTKKEIETEKAEPLPSSEE